MKTVEVRLRPLVVAVGAALALCALLYVLGPARSPRSAPLDTAPLPAPAPVPVTVIEEHGEAAAVWWAHHHLKPLHDALVIHIDGHSDFACPGDMPQPGTPRADNKIIKGAVNDDFVHRAMAVGMVGAAVWVKPDWLGDLFGRDPADFITRSGRWVSPREDLLLGFVASKDDGDDDDDIRGHRACQCLEAHTVAEDGTVTVDERVCEQGSEPMEADDCDIFKTTFTTTIESKLVPLFGLVRPEDAHRDVILDIDEDFFAVGDPVAIVRDAGWNNATLRPVDRALRAFCVHNPVEETDLAEYLEQSLRRGEVLRSSAVHRPMLCNGGSMKDFRAAVEEFLYSTDGATDDMIDALATIGFAGLAGISEWPRPMWLCIGVDNAVEVVHSEVEYKTNTLVDFYEPDSDEVNTRLGYIRRWLEQSGIQERVRLVTLCRSVRDGYLPRWLHPEVEQGVLDLLHDLFPRAKVDNTKVRPSWFF